MYLSNIEYKIMKNNKCKICGTTKDLILHCTKNKGTDKEIKCYKNICYDCRHKDKKCKVCGTTENLLPHYKVNKGTSEERQIYRALCYGCNNKRKLKGICKYCGTTENLMVRPIMNQHLKEPKIITQDVCQECFADLTRQRKKGVLRTEEEKRKISLSVTELHKDPVYKAHHSKMQKERYERPEEKERSSKILKKQWKDPKFRQMKIDAIKKMWEDPEFKQMKIETSKINFRELWKNPEYREKMTNMAKEYWSDPENRKKQSDTRKLFLKGKNPFNKFGQISSKPQKELYKLVKILFPTAEENRSIETKVSRRFPDALIEDYKLIIEYDGSYWHTAEADAERDAELKEVGYDVLHYMDYIPEMKELFSDVNKVISSRIQQRSQ